MAQTISPPPAQSPGQRGPVTGTAGKRAGRRKPFLLDIYSTAVGKKYVMAITGIIGIGFVVMHMLGNLKVYLGVVDGRYDIDVYGEFLRDLLVPILPRTIALWLLRIVLIAALAVTGLQRRTAVKSRGSGVHGGGSAGTDQPGVSTSTSLTDED